MTGTIIWQYVPYNIGILIARFGQVVCGTFVLLVADDAWKGVRYIFTHLDELQEWRTALIGSFSVLR